MSKWINTSKGARVNSDVHYVYNKWYGLRQVNQDKYTIDESWYDFTNFLKDVQSMDSYDEMVANKEYYSMKLKLGETHYCKDTFIITKLKNKRLLKKTVDTIKHHMTDEEYIIITKYIHKYYNKKTYYYHIKEEIDNIINMESVKAMHTYNSDSGIPFISYACSAIKIGVTRYFRDINRLKRSAIVESLDGAVTDDANLYDLLYREDNEFAKIHSKSYIDYLMRELNSQLTPNQKHILFERAKGRTMKEVANELGVSKAEIYRRLKKAQEAAKIIYNSID